MAWQNPKGTRDFYPADMAWRQYLTDAWRRVSVRHGFEQVDGPIFESLDLYKVKSGEGIISELFHFEDRGGRGLAIRPEFTPTLGRMVAAKANALPKPIKWFATPNFCRAERPQRGRLREFWQWNVDMLGMAEPAADAEVIAVAVDLLRELGLTPTQVRVKVSHREVVRQVLIKLGVPGERVGEAFELLDARDKLPPEAFNQQAGALGLDEAKVERLSQMCRRRYPAGGEAGGVDHLRRSIGVDDGLDELVALDEQIEAFGLAEWCEYDLGVVRGLAYYTGTVFELHEATGVERALAGGGRYDQLIELFGGPATPGVGFGMGDVVLTNVLQDKGLVPEEVAPRPDAVVLAVSDAAAGRVAGVVSQLRRAGLHTRMSYKTTRNLGKLMKDAQKARARQVVILDDAAADGRASVKDLDSGQQREVALRELVEAVRGAG
jgi:histidyl-tRNA synthetase